MKSFQTVLLVSLLVAVGIGFASCGGPKSATVTKIEKGIDDLKAGVDANPVDCAKMTAAIKGPVTDVVAGMQEAKAKNEKLPATTKLKIAGLATTIQKIGPCSDKPEMKALFQSLMASATMQ